MIIKKKYVIILLNIKTKRVIIVKERKWTPEQFSAIEQNGSVLVSASAGTGKTAVMTEKVVNFLIQSELSIDGILVITFSNAAAKEMAERISKRLAEISEDGTISKAKRDIAIKRRMNLSNAHIETFHAFCKDIISKHYYKVGISSDFKVGEPNTVKLIMKKATDKVLEEEFRNKNSTFIRLAEYIDGGEKIDDVIIASCNKMSNIVDLNAWKEKTIANYEINDEFSKEIAEMIKKDFSDAANLLKKAVDSCEDIKTKKKIEAELNTVLFSLEKMEYDHINAIDESTIECICTKITYPRKIDCTLTKKLRDEANKHLEFYKKNNITTKTQLERIKEMAPVVRYFIDVCQKVNEEFAKMKKNAHIIDFNDMEHLALKILEDNIIANQYRAQFGRIFIDEYQDTNPIQEAIIEKISKKNNLFCVGDFKQSIYRFRASDPTLFLNRSENYEKNALGTVISLNKNFRSSQNILNCANDVLDIASRTSSEINYDEEQKLIHNRDDDNESQPVVVRILNKNKRDIDTDPTEDLSTEEIEVYNTIDIIKNIIGKEIYNTKTDNKKPAEYGDICILCRKLSGISELFYKIFSQENIPFSIEKPTELFNTVEIENIINILELAENPNNDTGIIAFMHMGFFDFEDKDILEIRKFKYTESLYNNICLIATENSEIGGKCKLFLDFLERARRETGRHISEILNNILSELNYLDYIAVMPNGKQRISNIDVFKQYVYDYDVNNNKETTLYDFIKYIKKIKNDNPVVASEINSTIDTNRVKITTIHKSKGLEYPIVILPFVGKGFNKNDTRNNVVFDVKNGLGFRYFNNTNRSKGKTLVREFITREQAEKSVEEELRLLYVAMTRAKEILVIQGFCPDELEFSNVAKNTFDWVKNTIFPSGKFRYGEIKTNTGIWTIEKGLEKIEKQSKQAVSDNIRDKYIVSLQTSPKEPQTLTTHSKIKFVLPKIERRKN